MRRYHYLLTTSLATLLGCLAGPLLARYLLGISSPALTYYLQMQSILDVETVASLRVWTPATCVLLISLFLRIGREAHEQFESASETVLSHTLAFYRWRDRICTPGTVLDYLMWAYTYATVKALTQLATFVGLLIIPPFLLTQSWVWRAILLVPFFFFAWNVQEHVVTAIDRIYGEIPRRLGTNLRMFGHLIDYLLARDEEEASSAAPRK